jgi:hypothetical protein
MSATPTTQKNRRTPQQGGGPPPVSCRTHSESFDYSMELNMSYQRASCAESNMDDVSEQVSEMTLDPTLVKDQEEPFSLQTPVTESSLTSAASGICAPLPPPPFAMASSSGDHSSRHKRPSFHFTPPIGRDDNRSTAIRPKRYRSNSFTIKSKIHNAPRLPSSPDLSEAGEVHHEPCFSPVHQESMARIPTLVLAFPPPQEQHAAVINGALPPPQEQQVALAKGVHSFSLPPPMPLFGSPVTMDPSNNDTKSLETSPHLLQMRKVEFGWGFPHTIDISHTPKHTRTLHP